MATKVSKNLISNIDPAQINASGATSGQVLTYNDTTSKWEARAASGGSGSFLIVRDEKATGTHGGTSVAGTQTRTLNTVTINGIAGASLASNQITLPSGTYIVRAMAPAVSVSDQKASLYNVTDSAVEIVGTTVNGTASGASDDVTTYSFVVGSMTISSTKVFELRHYTSQAKGTFGLGYATSASLIEVYSIVEIQKIA